MAEITSSIKEFAYRPELIEPGTVYHYIKSNIDGSYATQIFIYVRDNDHLEVLKFEPHGMDAVLVKAHMDWETFSADRLESWVVTPDGKQHPQASLFSSYPDRRFTISWQGQNDSVRVGHYPVHVYNFDFISLNYILRHWIDPEGEVTIGILQPNFDPNPETIMKYEGNVVIRFLGGAEHNGASCRRYSIGGEGLKGYEGTMWVNKAKGHIEDIEIPLPDNPDWENFKFRLVSSEHMAHQGWMEFMEAEIQNLKADPGR